jgi:hypothetical protein
LIPQRIEAFADARRSVECGNNDRDGLSFDNELRLSFQAAI